MWSEHCLGNWELLCRLNEFDTGKYPIGASEMKAKLLSRQSIQTAAGNKTADFHEDDEVGSRCAEINQ